MYLQANQKLRHLRVKQFNLLSIATTLNKKLDTDYLLDETIACIPVFNKIETSLMNLEAIILEMKLKFSAIADDSKTKKDIDVRVEQKIEQKIEKELQNNDAEEVQGKAEENSTKKIIQDEQKAETDVEILAKKEVEIEIKTTSDKKMNDVVEKVEKQDAKSNDLLKNDSKSDVVANKRDIKVENTDNTEKIITQKSKEKLQEGVAAKGSKVQVPKIKIIKDAAKAWEGKEALKKAFKARD